MPHTAVSYCPTHRANRQRREGRNSPGRRFACRRLRRQGACADPRLDLCTATTPAGHVGDSGRTQPKSTLRLKLWMGPRPPRAPQIHSLPLEVCTGRTNRGKTPYAVCQANCGSERPPTAVLDPPVQVGPVSHRGGEGGPRGHPKSSLPKELWICESYQ